MPPHIVPGVEVAKGPGTSDETFEVMCELMRRTTIGFRMPFHGPFGHYDFSGAWRWPADPAANRNPLQEPSEEVRTRIQARMAERRPWFHAPDRMAEATAVRDREFVRRRKALYGVPRYGPPREAT